MATEHRYGHTFYAGLASPGPAADYTLTSSFANAAKKSSKPTWGPPPVHESQKLARNRTDEVRFHGRHFMGQMMGHFSPGPLYAVPGGIGGAPANRFALERKLQSDRTKYTGDDLMAQTSRSTQFANTMPGEPQFSLTQGSYADPLRTVGASGPEPTLGTDSTYWRQSTMVQKSEMHVTTPYKHLTTRREEVTPSRMPWTEDCRGPSTYGMEVQTQERDKLRDRSRAVTPAPFRNTVDIVADPPLANIFGPLKSHSDYGQVQKLGGLNRAWRESKVGGITTTGTTFGPPPKLTGKLRYAFVQQNGVNAVPRGSPHADCDGGRITMYRVDRPVTAHPPLVESSASLGGLDGPVPSSPRSTTRSPTSVRSPPFHHKGPPMGGRVQVFKPIDPAL